MLCIETMFVYHSCYLAQVTERALHMLKNPAVLTLMEQNKAITDEVRIKRCVLKYLIGCGLTVAYSNSGEPYQKALESSCCYAGRWSLSTVCRRKGFSDEALKRR